MLFVSINRLELLESIPKAVDAIELRLDLFPFWKLSDIENILNYSTHPILLTLRQTPSFSEEERESIILKLLELKPPFMDLECTMRKEFLEKTLPSYPQTAFILSYHNFKKTPEDLNKVFQTMSYYKAYHYKIAAMALSTNDALRMLLFGKEHPQVSVICMGEKGEFARVLGPVAGNLINYASIETKEQTAPGQISVDDLVNIYRFPLLNQNTALYGLIGDPITNSQGHLYHNNVFAKKNLNAVYVKMNVKAEELPAFFSMAKKIGFKGLSVTMPLKEKVLPFLNEKAKAIGAINTLRIEEETIFETNTDGVGALDALEKRGLVRNKVIIILGAGGAARSIAFEAIKRGATVWILNRTVERAKELANLLHCNSGGLQEVPSQYDILINCSPDSSALDVSIFYPSALVMDIVYVPRETPFLQEAKRHGCQIVYGEEMFWNQAAAQTRFWLGE